MYVRRELDAVTALASKNLPAITDVAVPSYDRAKASVGILHFGFGNFHRSHEAMYVDQLMESGQGLDWGICGVGILPQDAAMRDVMHAQDCLFTLVIRHPDGSLEPRVVGSVLEYLFGPDNPEAVYARLMDPAIRIVSLTVTEGGYLKNAATGEFDALDAAVLHDLADPLQPQTAFCVAAARRGLLPSPCFPATTSRATATSPAARSLRSRTWWIQPLATGSTPAFPSPTAWSTA
jgi:mannitol 2-dehydrogenase